MYRTLLLDIAGVLHEDDKPLDGAIEAVSALRDAGVTLRFVTNSSRTPRQNVHNKLCDLGFDIKANELFTAPLAARRWLEHRCRQPFLLIHPDLREDFDGMQTDNPDTVVLADAEDALSYQNLDTAFALLMEGRPLLAIGYNRYFRSGGRLHLDAGPFVRALEYAAGVKAVVAGKPSADFFAQVLADTDCAPNDALMVGDDVVADVQGALDVGMHACLVQTGKYRPHDEDNLTGDAIVAPSLGELARTLLSQGFELDEL